MARNDKNRMQDLEKKRKSLFLLGIIAAAAMTLTAFEWRTNYDISVLPDTMDDSFTLIESDLYAVNIEKEQAVEVASTSSSKTQFKISDLIPVLPDKKELEPIKKIETGTKKTEPMKLPGLKGSEMGLKGAGPMNPSNLSAHELPFMFSCANIINHEERFHCTEDAIAAHLRNNLKIPSARDLKELPRLFYVQFIVDEYGAVGSMEYSKHIPAILQREVDRVFHSIPFMQAAQVNGRNVKVIFAIPVHLKREG